MEKTPKEGRTEMLKDNVRALLHAEGIEHAALLPFSACRVTNARLYEREGILPSSVLIFLIPYFATQPDNFSAYAAGEDYHLYAKGLFARLTEGLAVLFPDGAFLGVADHSPIDERDAAVRAGLGVFGKNRLLLSRAYGSYQFIGEILSTLPPERLGEVALSPFTECIGCNACLAACPTGVLRGESTECLSAITQKKGTLTEEEKALMRALPTAWGCDECQRVCPYTREALAKGTAVTSIPYFKEHLITHLDTETLAGMYDEEFSRRAFAWRGRKTVMRNVRILEEK